MKSKHIIVGVMTIVVIFFVADILAQGGVTPPGAPGETMKSLQEIWEKIEEQRTDIEKLKSRNCVLSEAFYQSGAILFSLGATLPWNVSIVDSLNDVGRYSSLAFGPDGQPAVAYYDYTNGTLKFACRGLLRQTPGL